MAKLTDHDPDRPKHALATARKGSNPASTGMFQPAPIWLATFLIVLDVGVGCGPTTISTTFLSTHLTSVTAPGAKAKSTGKPVAVDAMTTETSPTVINPDGTASTTDNTHAVRTKRGKAWAQLDATLRKNSDGTLSPAIGAVVLTISGGGSGPMDKKSHSHATAGGRLARARPSFQRRPPDNGPDLPHR
ncbi:hypothetical protein [Streptomyces sp. NPDC046685]|uniref:hypothetical protein n=1 Tax=Streptomyces sp. NPDC046685 TaxID=3157202 RepID=UPI0033F1C494